MATNSGKKTKKYLVEEHCIVDSKTGKFTYIPCNNEDDNHDWVLWLCLGIMVVLFTMSEYILR